MVFFPHYFFFSLFLSLSLSLSLSHTHTHTHTHTPHTHTHHTHTHTHTHTPDVIWHSASRVSHQRECTPGLKHLPAGCVSFARLAGSYRLINSVPWEHAQVCVEGARCVTFSRPAHAPSELWFSRLSALAIIIMASCSHPVCSVTAANRLPIGTDKDTALWDWTKIIQAVATAKIAIATNKMLIYFLFHLYK